MLPQKNRINLKKEFRPITASCEKLDDPLFKLFYRPSTEVVSRVGISLSAKVFKRAVDRNRARRLLATAFYDLLPGFHRKMLIIALPKQKILEYNAASLSDYLGVVLKRLDI